MSHATRAVLIGITLLASCGPIEESDDSEREAAAARGPLRARNFLASCGPVEESDDSEREAAAARGTLRVIAPGGTGTACLAASPCSFATAYKASAAGDVIQARGGRYTRQSWAIAKPIVVEAYGAEVPVLDGEDAYPPPVSPATAPHGALITIAAPGVVLRGLTVTRSTGRGIAILADGDQAKVLGCTVSQSWGSGIAAASNSPSNLVVAPLIEDSAVTRNCRSHLFATDPGARPSSVPASWDFGSVWPAALSLVRTDGGIVRRTRVYQNFFEGLGLYKHTQNSLVEESEVYGNFRLQLYVSNAHRNTVRNSLIYGTAPWHTRTDGKALSGYGFGAVILSGENLAGFTGGDHGNRVYGNFVASSQANLILGGQTACPLDGTGNTCGEMNSRVFNNVFVEADERDGQPGYAVKVGAGSRAGNVCLNNAFLQNGGQTDAVTPGRVTFGNNLWSRLPTARARGTQDLYQPYSLARSQWRGVAPGALSRSDWALAATSLARGKGAWLARVDHAGGYKGATQIRVDDDLCFRGDERLSFSSGATTTITAIDRTTHTLTVSPAVTVPDRAGLTLQGFVSAGVPNIGPWGPSL